MKIVVRVVQSCYRNILGTLRYLDGCFGGRLTGNLKYSTMSPNNLSTEVRTLDIDLLKTSICAVRAAPLNGP